MTIQIPEHRTREILCYEGDKQCPKGDECGKPDTHTQCPTECIPDCPGCAAEAILKQVIEMVKELRNYNCEEIRRMTVDEIYNRNTAEKFKAKVAVLNQLLTKLEAIK